MNFNIPAIPGVEYNFFWRNVCREEIGYIWEVSDTESYGKTGRVAKSMAD